MPTSANPSLDARDSQIPLAIFDQAVDWMVLLQSGEMSAQDEVRFDAWQRQDNRHHLAWEQVTRNMHQALNPIREAGKRHPQQLNAAEQALLRPGVSASKRKFLGGVLALTTVGIGTGLVVKQQGMLPMLTADISTGTGERQTLALDDGSELILNAQSAVDIEFNSMARRVYLRQGEIIASVVADGARPFIVETRHGSVRALGTRYLVRQEENRSLAMVLEHSVQVQSKAGQTITLQESRSAWFEAGRIHVLAEDLRYRAAWENGMLSARDESLADVIQAVRQYRRGLIRVSPEAAKLRVLGAFPLDDTDKLLESLEQTLPIAIKTYSPWLVMIDIRA